MSMELLCVIDVSHGIDKNIIKIAFVPIYIFFMKSKRRLPPEPGGRPQRKRFVPAAVGSWEVRRGAPPEK